MKIINYSLVFSSFFIITACSSNQPSKTTPSTTRVPISLCTGGYSTKSHAGIEAGYKERNGKITVEKGKSENGQLNINGFEGDTAVHIYDKYIDCVQSQSNKGNEGSISTYGAKSPVIKNEGNNSNDINTVSYAN